MNPLVLLFRLLMLPVIRRLFDKIPYAVPSARGWGRFEAAHPALAESVVAGDLTFQQAVVVGRASTNGGRVQAAVRPETAPQPPAGASKDIVYDTERGERHSPENRMSSMWKVIVALLVGALFYELSDGVPSSDGASTAVTYPSLTSCLIFAVFVFCVLWLGEAWVRAWSQRQRRRKVERAARTKEAMS